MESQARPFLTCLPLGLISFLASCSQSPGALSATCPLPGQGHPGPGFCAAQTFFLERHPLLSEGFLTAQSQLLFGPMSSLPVTLPLDQRQLPREALPF